MFLLVILLMLLTVFRDAESHDNTMDAATHAYNIHFTTQTGVVLDHCLPSVLDWVRANKLKLYAYKKETLLVGGSFFQTCGRYPVQDRAILSL